MPLYKEQITFPQFECSHCGTPVDLRDYRRSATLPVMMQKQMCYTCAYWLDKVDNMPEHHYIIDGKLVVFYPWTKVKTVFDSCNTRGHYIMLNNGEVKRSNNMYISADVPAEFRELLPDMARFVSREVYYKAKNNPFFKCRAKGCWDRYRCYWYDMTLEADGPWNEIPASHKIGGEGCESFIDKETL